MYMQGISCYVYVICLQLDGQKFKKTFEEIVLVIDASNLTNEAKLNCL